MTIDLNRLRIVIVVRPTAQSVYLVDYTPILKNKKKKKEKKENDPKKNRKE